VIEVSKAQVIEAVREVVGERPEYIYTNQLGEVAGQGFTRCYYVHTDKAGKRSAGCLVGAVLARLGVPLEAMQEAGNTTAAFEVVPQVIDLGNKADNDFTVNYLAYLQREQDNGASWGYALASANDAFELSPVAA
jgi:hypothetical protein